MTTILIVEDEQRIAEFVSRGLQAAGYQTEIIDDGLEALERAQQPDIDLVLLDIGLPSMDGLEVLRELRGRGNAVPVIILTARSSTRETVEGLDAGASDYVPKPFTFDELLARVRSRLRDTVGTAPTALSHGDIVMDILARRVTVGSKEVELSAREFALAEQFLRSPGQVLSREVLLSRVWGMDFDPGSNVVDVYVRYLRTKVGAHHIATVRGAGYRWE